jgi:hypothetical protein
MSQRIVSALASVLLLVTLVGVSEAQQKPSKEAKPSLKAKGRLPAYYKDVVTQSQKESIYKIQSSYGDQITKLAEEMKALTEKRDAEIEALLSAEQKAKVATLKAEAAKKKATAEVATDETVKPLTPSKTPVVGE